MKAVDQPWSKRRPDCPEEVVFLDLLRTTDMLARGLVTLLKTEELSANQYNVLRILRGTLEGLPCGEIASRMITRESGHYPPSRPPGEAEADLTLP